MRVAAAAVRCALVGAMLGGGMSGGQIKNNKVPVPAAVEPAAGVEYRSYQSLEALSKVLLEKAKGEASGNESVTMDEFPTHWTMISTRQKSGGAEFHAKVADILVMMDGEATEITGGTIVDRKDDGEESRGTRVEGGKSQVLKKGDVMTIAAGVPHQMLVPAGRTVTYFVVKVRADAGK